jgi:cell division protein ZapA (FtsZ GTPase activity inhibitor)
MVSIKVMGKVLDIQADENERLDYLRISEYINDIYEGVKNESSVVPDTLVLCSLTTIQIVKELFKIKRLQDTASNKYEKKLNELIKQLEP